MDPYLKRLWRYSPLLLAAMPVAAQTTRDPLRFIAPVDFYQASGGSDNNKCTQALPCLTVAHTIAYALTQYDAIGNNLTIHIGAGTINQGILIGGPVPGGAGVSTNGGSLTLIGAGSGSTIINNTGCSGTTDGISVGGGAYVRVGSMSVGTTCGGSGIGVQQNSTVYLADGDVKLTAASYAQVFVYGHSLFHGNTFNLGLSGNATFAFAGSTYGVIQLGSGSTLTLTGTPAYTSFLDLIDGSMFDPGIGSTITGAATGTKYSLNLNSFIDMEDVALSTIPGNAQGNVANGSYIFNNTGALGACVGGAVGCAVATAPTGAGAGAAFAMGTGSGDAAGVVAMTAGTGAADTGVIHVSTPSVVAGPGHQGGFCTASLWGSTMNWDPLATVLPFYTAGDLTIQWANNSVALTNGQTYAISYVCQ
jgi:hypothetical protein